MDGQREGGRTGNEAKVTKERVGVGAEPPGNIGWASETAGSEGDGERHIASSLGNKRIEISPSP